MFKMYSLNQLCNNVLVLEKYIAGIPILKWTIKRTFSTVKKKKKINYYLKNYCVMSFHLVTSFQTSIKT